MNIKRTETPGIAVADQPSEEDLRSLKAAGYTGVINLRNDGEPEQPIGTSEEGELVRASGLEYLHYGVGGAPLSAAGVGSVDDFLSRHTAKSGKVLVHCRKGSRAAALVLLHLAGEQKWGADEAVARGRELGLEVDGGLRTLVENYLRDRHVGA
jgi:uncharacterized protein (TIGR01244 family)